MLFNMGYMTIFILVLVILAFSSGLLLPVLGKAFFRGDNQNILVRFFHYLKARAGYIASFGAGALLVAFIAYNANPYAIARWSGTYDAVTIGHMILIDKTAMQTGKIPKKATEWYLANFNQITGERL